MMMMDLTVSSARQTKKPDEEDQMKRSRRTIANEEETLRRSVDEGKQKEKKKEKKMRRMQEICLNKQKRFRSCLSPSSFSSSSPLPLLLPRPLSYFSSSPSRSSIPLSIPVAVRPVEGRKSVAELDVAADVREADDVVLADLIRRRS